jgi:F-box and WD-40 domain protein 1/11
MRALDSPLWKLLFRLEGWNADFVQVRECEETERARRLSMKERKARARGAEEMDYEKPLTKKRQRERPLIGDGSLAEGGIRERLEPLSLESSQDGPHKWAEQYGAVEADDSPSVKTEDGMEGISYQDDSPSSALSPRARRKQVLSPNGEDIIMSPSPATPIDPPVHPSLFLSATSEPKLNWQYLYKQKKRLEDNWNAGRFTNFQLPHPDHPEEAHTECVYTIQYSGRFLVSGSRDKSVRIWDIDTQRLVRPPLVGHTASVLCLQFDHRPTQNVVISAGSDCNVILWEFSTGRLLRKLEKAHAEPVLNLRFDDQYLVTCSKDKTIKVWTRKMIWPTDDAYPTSTTSGARFPSYIINMQHQYENQHLRFKPVQEYSLLMVLEGHGAAVNAIQILDGQIVSASGDRSVKAWDVHTGACLRTFPGHSKGIACVQFDGRRIVSGSSDETVRIFDRATGAEVACLQAHTQLVRTVQAQFGDLPGNEEELEAEARAVDREFFEARENGLVPEPTRQQFRTRNAGSRDPSKVFAYGAKLPPGGGGSKWARIVSGSYDETVIIWRRQADGNWTAAMKLQQSEAVRAAGGRPRRPVAHAQNHTHANHLNVVNQNQQQPAAPQNAVQAAHNQFQALAHQAQQQAHAAQNIAQQAQALHAATLPQNLPATATPTANPAPTAAQHGNTATATAQPSQNQAQTPNPTPQQQTHTTATAAPTAAAAAAPPPQPHHHHHNHAPHHHHHHPLAGPLNTQAGGTAANSRVFKLQFDARRIICCSQNPIIVGWDFANNDDEIVVASRFFGSEATG